MLLSINIPSQGHSNKPVARETLNNHLISDSKAALILDIETLLRTNLTSLMIVFSGAVSSIVITGLSLKIKMYT